MKYALLLILMAFGLARAEDRDWPAVGSFAYQLQNLDLEQAGSSPFDLLVIDVSLHGDEVSRLNAEQLRGLQRKPDGSRRLLLAYLSIGEAEDYRGYWKPGWEPGSPLWLAEVNPDWPGNYPVQFWHPEWQAIVFEELDRIVEAGFDGVYLDRIDVYELFPEHRQEMIDLVLEISRRGRQSGGADFGVFPQNAEELLEEPRYLAAITGIARRISSLDWRATASPRRPRPPKWPHTGWTEPFNRRSWCSTSTTPTCRSRLPRLGNAPAPTDI